MVNTEFRSVVRQCQPERVLVLDHSAYVIECPLRRRSRDEFFPLASTANGVDATRTSWSSKWIEAIEFVESFDHIGWGQGGYNEDHEFYGYRMPI